MEDRYVRQFKKGALEMILPALTPWMNIFRVVGLYGVGLIMVLWPRNTISRMDSFRPTLWRAAGLTVVMVWSVLSFTGITTFFYSNF